MRRYTGKRFSGEAVLDYKFLANHFGVSPSTLYNEVVNPDTWIWPVIDKHFAKLNNRPIHLPSGEALRLSQALAYLSGEGLAINRTTLWRKEKAGDITPVIITSDIKLFTKSDLNNLIKPFCYNIADMTGLDTPCQHNKFCQFKDCTWHGFFELI